jgi:hypothetical protein
MFVFTNKTNLKMSKTLFNSNNNEYRNQKILTTHEQTNVDNIYAIGDVMDETSANNRVLELTPVRSIRENLYLIICVSLNNCNSLSLKGRYKSRSIVGKAFVRWQ